MGKQRIGSVRQIDFLVLAILNEGPMHGYGIVQRLSEMTDGRVDLRPGDVYRVLYRMHDSGQIEPVPEGHLDENERRSYYRITDAGREAATEQAELLAGVSAQLLARAGR